MGEIMTYHTFDPRVLEKYDMWVTAAVQGSLLHHAGPYTPRRVEELARASGLTPARIEELLTADGAPPNISELAALAVAFGVSIRDFFTTSYL